MAVDPTKKLDFDKLPGTLESVNSRKSTSEFVFSIATPQKYEEYAKQLISRLSGFGIFLFVPCTPDEADGILQRDHSGAAPQMGTPAQEIVEGRFVDVATMADLLGMTDRNVQLQVEKGFLVSPSRNQYDTLASCGTLWKALKEAETGKNDAYNEERTGAMRLKRLERERLHEEAMKRLVNYDELLAARERKNADIKQKLLFLEKTLPPRLNLLPANEQEPIIKNEIRKLLAEFATAPVPGIGDHGSGQDIPAASGPDRQPVGGRKKKTRKQNKR